MSPLLEGQYRIVELLLPLDDTKIDYDIFKGSWKTKNHKIVFELEEDMVIYKLKYDLPTLYHNIDKRRSYYGFDVPMTEKHYNAKFMGSWAIRVKDEWTESPVDVFYQPNPDASLGHSHYFGLYTDYTSDGDRQTYITNAKSAFSQEIAGGICSDGEVIVSGYRHDYINTKGALVDGGRDYLRTNDCKTVNIIIDKSEFTFGDIQCHCCEL